MAISQIPTLPWEIIFGRPSFGRSTPTSNGNFTDSCEIHISFLLWELNIWPTRSWHIYTPVKWQFYRFLLYSQSSYLADPLSNGDFTESCEIHISFLLWELNIWQTRSWQIYPRSNGNFTDSCSDSSHFMTAHISFLLWELNIWQTRSWQIYPHLSGNFTDSYSDNFYFIPTLRAYHLADQVLAYLPPHPMVISQIPALTAHYSESSTFGRPGLVRCNPPISDGNFTDSCSTLRAHIWQTKCWQINPPSYGNFTDCCSDSSYFIPTLRAQYLADKVFADLPPCQMAILQIPVKFLFHSCSKSSTFGRPGLGRSTPLIKGNFTDSCSTLRAHIWQTKVWQIYPLSNGNFTDCSSDSSYFIPTLRANHLAGQVLTDLPPHQMAISQIPALTAPCSKRSTFDRPSFGRSTPCQLAILQIAPLTAHISFLLWELNIWLTRSWQIYPPPSNGNFTDSCSDSPLL